MKVLITGAAGGVGQLLLPGLTGKYELTLTDIVAIPNVEGARTILGDLTDAGFAVAVTAGVDAVVHLAANPDPQSTWQQLLAPNIRVVTTLLDAAVTNGVGRLVLASSAHAMGQYVWEGRRPIDPAWPTAPCCPYGATKAFVEAAARAHSFRYGTRIACLRLGATFEKPNGSMLDGWLAPEDLQQLVRRCLDADLAFGIFHGISANTRSSWDITNARNELGYAPVRDSAEFAGTVGPDIDGGLCSPFAVSNDKSSTTDPQ
jgi:nucleoside-diphosphate-sugar epimerase